MKCVRTIMCTLEISKRGELSLWHLRVGFCILGLVLQGHKGGLFVLERFHFLFCLLCLELTAHLTAFNNHGCFW